MGGNQLGMGELPHASPLCLIMNTYEKKYKSLTPYWDTAIPTYKTKNLGELINKLGTRQGNYTSHEHQVSDTEDSSASTAGAI